MSTYAYKFLGRGARGAVSDFRWPLPSAGQPGPWVTATAPVRLCEAGVHACRRPELAHWLHHELWVVELDGTLVEGIDCVVAQRGRLIRHLDSWVSGAAARFATAARDHAAEFVAKSDPEHRPLLSMYLGDASWHLPNGATALAAFCAAMTVARFYGKDRFDEAAYREERVWQSNWIAEHLSLAV